MAGYMRLLCGLFIGVLGLSACGGGGGAGSGAANVPPVAGGTSRPGSAALAIFVPAASSGSSIRRRRDLPAGTQSVEIYIASTSGSGTAIAPVIANVSSTAPGCSSVSGGISCTVNVSIADGTYVFGVIGFTGANASGNPIAWGETEATVSPSGSNTVAITTASVVAYFVMNLDGNISLVSIDHSANTIVVANENQNTSISGTISYLPNGDEKVVVTSSTDSGTPVGSIVYLRELVGTAISFFATNSSSPPANGLVSSGADWGVGSAVTACPTANASYDASLVTVEGPQYQVGSNLTTGSAFQNGTATIAITGGSANLTFNGTSYTVNGTMNSSQTGNAGPCSGDIFAATSSSGQLSFDPQGVIVGASNGAGSSSSEQSGEIGFTVQSGSTLDLTAITSATYDGFLGNFQVTGSSTTKSAEAINVAPGGSNTLLGCSYSNFEAGTINTSDCATISFGTQPFPGIILGTVTSAGQPVPAVFSVGQVGGKYIVFGVVGSGNIALFQH